MESVKKIQEILKEITKNVKGVELCSIVTADGFDIVSSSSESLNEGIDGDLISGVMSSANKITDFIVNLKTKKLILNFEKKEIVLIALNDHIFLVYIANMDSNRTLILLNLKKKIELIKNLIKEY